MNKNPYSMENNNSFLHDQKGFSLVELIIVIAVLSVVMGMFMMGINMIFSLPARECARELKSAIEKTRIDTMGKTDKAAKLKIRVDSDGFVYVQEQYLVAPKIITSDQPSDPSMSEEKRLCDRPVIISWVNTNGGSENVNKLESSNPKYLFFKRDTGGFADDCDYVDTIRIESGSDTWELKLYKLTGAVELERK